MKIFGDPRQRELVLEIEVSCVRKAEGLFIKNKLAKLGQIFDFSPDLYSISGTIIGIKAKEAKS